MKCPNCGDAADSMCITYGTASSPVAFVQCSCGLSGPREVLKSLSRRLSPEGVMAEALRILRERGSPLLYPAAGGVLACKGGKWADGKDIGAVLDALDAKLVASNPERPDSSGGG